MHFKDLLPPHHQRMQSHVLAATQAIVLNGEEGLMAIKRKASVPCIYVCIYKRLTHTHMYIGCAMLVVYAIRDSDQSNGARP